MTSLAARAGAALHNIATPYTQHMKTNRVHKFAMDMRYNLVLGDYRRLRNFTEAPDKMGTCPNELRHGKSERSHNPSKGGRCLINCIGGSKIYIHNAVVATLAKRINGKGFDAKPGEAIIHETVR